jgi:peptide-methionine (S)-S-oxide reductase
VNDRDAACHHQQYLIKNPFGYRCHSATGIKVPR